MLALWRLLPWYRYRIVGELCINEVKQKSLMARLGKVDADERVELEEKILRITKRQTSLLKRMGTVFPDEFFAINCASMHLQS